MKIATLTFHGAHNFGSSLQSFALQTVIENLCKEKSEPCEYSIINYRTKLQKDLYALIPKERGIKGVIKLMMRLPYYSQYKKKYEKFEDFIANDLNTGEEVSTLEEIKEKYKDIDVYLGGSDQIWNVRSFDFSSVYYLPFENSKKISYAASFGPLKIDWAKYNKEEIANYLKDYDAISVREEGSADNVEELTQIRPEVHVDPTMLLSKEEWREVSSGATYKGGNYILLYCLEPSKEQLKMAKQISKKLRLPVVITKYNNKNDYFNGFKKLYWTGPKDFVSLIDNASLVLTSSFHGTAFSLIFNKKFYAFNGMKDKRISNVLVKSNMQSRSINSFEDIQDVNLDELDFSSANEFILEEKQKSIDYLKGALFSKS